MSFTLRHSLDHSKRGVDEVFQNTGGSWLNAYDVYLGPATGPRFMVTSGFERAFLDATGLEGTKYFAGASAGIARFTSLLMSKITGEDVFSEYVHHYTHMEFNKETFEGKPHKVTELVDGMLRAWATPARVDALLGQRQFVLMILVDEVNSTIRSWPKPFKLAAFGAAALANLVTPRAQRWLHKRHCFFSGGGAPPTHLFSADTLANLHFHPLTADNFYPALLASNTVWPYAQPVEHIAGVGDGWFMDGGLGTYMLNTHVVEGNALLLAHTPELKATFLDSWVPWRGVAAHMFERVTVLHPTSDFVRDLHAEEGVPFPELDDWIKMHDKQDERQSMWKRATAFAQSAFPSSVGDFLHNTTHHDGHATTASAK